MEVTRGAREYEEVTRDARESEEVTREAGGVTRDAGE